MKHFLFGFAAGAIASAVVILACRNRSEQPPIIITDTVTVTDTLVITRPVERERVVVRTVVETLPVAEADTAATARVEVPIERIVYQTDSFRAVLSGFHTALDTLRLLRPTTTITRTIPAKPRRWALSLTAGAALTPRGLQPALTLGLSYTLLQF